MNLSATQRNLMSMPFLRDAFPIGCQLGLPQLEVTGEHLCLKYYPHKLLVKRQAVELSSPMFKLLILLPQIRIVEFQNLIRLGRKPFQPSVCKIQSAYLEGAIGKITQLCRSCERAIDSWTVDHDPNAVKRYHCRFQAVVNDLDLSEIYSDSEL